MLVAMIEMLIADIKALVEAIGANGVSAILPCFLCRYVMSFKAKAQPAFAAVNKLVDFSCRDKNCWGQHTDASLLKLLNDLKAAKVDPNLTTKEYKQKVTLSGYKPVTGNFLLNEHTLAGVLIAKIMCDWMHLFFQTGNWNRELFAVLYDATSRTFNAYGALADYVGTFTFPRSHSFRNPP